MLLLKYYIHDYMKERRWSLSFPSYSYRREKKEAKERLRGHRGTITQLGQENTQAPVGVHFRAPGHSYADLSFIPIEKIRSRDSMVRKVRESYYIQKFNSVRSGLNKKT